MWGPCPAATSPAGSSGAAPGLLRAQDMLLPGNIIKHPNGCKEFVNGLKRPNPQVFHYELFAQRRSSFLSLATAQHNEQPVNYFTLCFSSTSLLQGSSRVINAHWPEKSIHSLLSPVCCYREQMRGQRFVGTGQCCVLSPCEAGRWHLPGTML